MGDDDGRAVGLQHVEGAAHRLLVHRVEMRGRLVQDQDRRVLEEGAGDGDALALAAGELVPRSPTAESSPSGRGHDQLASEACSMAACSSASLASGRAIRMLLRSVSLKR